MAITNAITDKLARLPLAYGRHVVKGVLTKQNIDTNPKAAQIQVALGAASMWDAVNQKWFGGGWDSAEHIYYNGLEIPGADYHFHSGGPGDAPDAIFPGDIPHPKASSYSAKVPQGPADELAANGGAADAMSGIFKCLQVADYNEDGDQVDDLGAPIPGGADSINYLYYSPSPARHTLDLMLRARRSIVRVNYPAWVDWRDYCATLIDWDDGALTPHQISLAASAGGTLAPATYWVRVATKKGADISSASKDRATDGIHTASVVCSGSNLRFTIEWASQQDRGATGYRVYVGTSEGGENKFFDVGSGATNTLLVTTLTGASTGTPPEIATGALLRQIPRFESHVFFVPPFDLATAFDRIAQITCMDWHYANGKVVFLSPEVRAAVFTLNLAEIGNGSFKTYQTDRRQKPNQIIVNYRDLDDPYLSQADPPVTVNRQSLQEKEGVRPFEINGGCMYRSQAERVGNYWARRLIDSDQMIELVGSPRTYIVLPGDPINVTHDVPNWTDVPFYVESKEEQEDSKAGFPMTGRIYGAWYSDTDHNPLPRPLPINPANPFAEPPIVTSVTLTQKDTLSVEGLVTSLHGAVQFAAFIGRQRGRVWWWPPGASGYELTQIELTPDPDSLQSAFEIPSVAAGLHKIKVVTESELGVSKPFADHAAYTFTVVAPAGSAPANFSMFFDAANGNGLNEWSGVKFPAAPILEVYDLEYRNSGDTATIRGPLTITPALNTEMAETPPLVAVTGGGSLLPAGRYTFVDPGGATITFNSHEHSSSKGWVRSAASIELIGGARVDVQLPINRIFPRYFSLLPYDSATGFGGFFWFRMSPSVYDPLGVNYISAEGITPGYPLTPGDRPAMVVQPDGTVEYHINYSPSSHPLYVSANTVDFTKVHKVNFVETDPSFDNISAVNFGFDKLRWVRQGPEFLYTGDMQKADNSGSLPATVKARVRQRSFYAGGAPSAWVNGSFAR